MAMSTLTIAILRRSAAPTGTSLQVGRIYHSLPSVYRLRNPDKTRFPSGMKWLTDQIHDLGLLVLISPSQRILNSCLTQESRNCMYPVHSDDFTHSFSAV
jgi:hypothetical protein